MGRLTRSVLGSTVPASAACVVAILLAGCLSPNPSVSPSASVDPSPSAVAQACPALELRTPLGARIDLSGTWTGGNVLHEMRQLGDCVWWVGQSNFPGEPLGSEVLNTFHGHITEDFTLTGEFAEIYHRGGLLGPRQGSVTFLIDITEVNGVEQIVLRNQATDIREGNNYFAATLIRADDVAAP